MPRVMGHGVESPALFVPLPVSLVTRQTRRDVSLFVGEVDILAVILLNYLGSWESMDESKADMVIILVRGEGHLYAP